MPIICKESDCRKFDSMERNHCKELLYVPRDRVCVEFERVDTEERRGKKARGRDDD